MTVTTSDGKTTVNVKDALIVNNHEVLTKSDFGTAAENVSEGNHNHDDQYYTETEINNTLNTKVDITTMDVDGTLMSNSDNSIATQKAVKTYVDNKISNHDSQHDDRYYTETEINYKLDTINEKITRGGVLATLIVKNRTLHSSFPDTVTYNSSTGLVTFPNPENLSFVPVISNIQELYYNTSTHYIREINPPNQFRVWNTPLDTGGRNSAPYSFSAVVFGF